jgi:Zn-dependent protease with chaperone function
MTGRIAHALHRAVIAAGDDPDRYSFAMIKTPVAAVASDEEATLYVTEGLMRLPMPTIEAAIAHEVAHEVMGHVGTRRALSLSITAGFSVLGILLPGVGLLDFVANPLAVRAFSRRQELEADKKAVEILRGMGYASPRRVLADGLRALNASTPRAKEEAQGLLASHPSLAERLIALEPLESAHAGAEGAAAGASPAAVGGREPKGPAPAASADPAAARRPRGQ